MGKYSLVIFILVIFISGCSKDTKNNFELVSSKNEDSNYSTSINDESITNSNNDQGLEDEEVEVKVDKAPVNKEPFQKLTLNISNMGNLVSANKELLVEIHLGKPSKDTKKEYQALLSEFEDERNELSKSVEEISKLEDLYAEQKKIIQENTKEFSENLYMYLRSNEESYLEKVNVNINKMGELK